MTLTLPTGGGVLSAGDVTQETDSHPRPVSRSRLLWDLSKPFLSRSLN